jgi:hypothetical protein
MDVFSYYQIKEIKIIIELNLIFEPAYLTNNSEIIRILWLEQDQHTPPSLPGSLQLKGK